MEGGGKNGSEISARENKRKGKNNGSVGFCSTQTQAKKLAEALGQLTEPLITQDIVMLLANSFDGFNW